MDGGADYWVMIKTIYLSRGHKPQVRRMTPKFQGRKEKQALVFKAGRRMRPNFQGRKEDEASVSRQEVV